MQIHTNSVNINFQTLYSMPPTKINYKIHFVPIMRCVCRTVRFVIKREPLYSSVWTLRVMNISYFSTLFEIPDYKEVITLKIVPYYKVRFSYCKIYYNLISTVFFLWSFWAFRYYICEDWSPGTLFEVSRL